MVFFVIRLFGITNPPLETGHNWRQSLTNMIARNFYERGIDLLHPMIDMAGEKSGIIGSEFPLLNALIALMSFVFGYEHWFGRLINLFITSLGSLAYYKLIRALFTGRIAFSATLILLSSIWFTFGRKIMPDTISVSLLLMGFWFGFRYLRGDQGRWLLLISFFLLTTLGLLCKIPALALMGCLIVVPVPKKYPVGRKTIVVLTGGAAVAIAFLWYFYWVPYLLEAYRFQLFFPKTISEGWAEIRPLIPELSERFYFSALKSYIAFAAFLAGAFLFLRRGNVLLISALGAITLLFAAFVIKTGAVFPLHNYYVIPFVPVMALAAGHFVGNLRPVWGNLILLLIMVESIANQQHDFFIKPDRLYKLSLESITEEHLPEEGLVVINGGPSPTDMYFAHRRGWTVSVAEGLDMNQLDSLTGLGAAYLILDRHYTEETLDLPLIYGDDDYLIYRLKR